MKKTIVLWCAILLTALLLYQVFMLRVRMEPSRMAAQSVQTIQRNIDYSVVRVEQSVDDIRAKLDFAADGGWELVSPIVQDGTTTGLIFKRQTK